MINLEYAISDIENMEGIAGEPHVAPYLHDLNSASVVLAAFKEVRGFLKALAEKRTQIVSSADCHEIEIAEARADGRFYVDSDGYGFVLRLVLSPSVIEGALPGLPAGCPDVMAYNPKWQTTDRKIHLHPVDRFCPAFGCTPVEIHPEGTRALLAASSPKGWEPMARVTITSYPNNDHTWKCSCGKEGAIRFGSWERAANDSGLHACASPGEAQTNKEA